MSLSNSLSSHSRRIVQIYLTKLAAWRDCRVRTRSSLRVYSLPDRSFRCRERHAAREVPGFSTAAAAACQRLCFRATRALAARIAARAPIAVQMAKQAIGSGNAYQVMEQVTAAAAVGLAAFTEKRSPRYRGR